MTTQQRCRNAVIIFVITAFVVYYTRDWNRHDRPSSESQSDPAYVLIRGETMGTVRYNVKYFPEENSPSKEVVEKQIADVLAEINQQMSTYDPESELSRFNSSNSADWFEVSQATADVVAAAILIAQKSSGKFDPTVGPLVNLWSFGPDSKKFEVPADAVIKAALKRVGYQQIDVRETSPALRKSNPDVYLDLSAIAKGYAVDRVSELLSELGLNTYLVEIGGEMRCKGRKPDGSLWTLAIEKPSQGIQEIQRKFQATDCAIATSGDYRNFYVEDGKKYSHTIDPSTGKPVIHQLASATVLEKNCTNADAYATALMVLGPEEGYNWAIEHDLAVLLLIYKDGKIIERSTPEFKEWAGDKK